MKIAVFTDSFFPGIGGTEFAVYNLCKELKKSGHEIIFFAPDYHCEQKFEEFKVYRVKSVAVSKNDMAVLAKAEYRRVLKLAAAFAPDVIYFCTASGMARLAVKCGEKLNVPVVATIHTKFKDAFYDSTKSNFITNVMIKSLVKKLEKADKVTTVSYDMKRELYNYGFKGEVEVIRNGFPEITVAHSESEKNLLTGKPANFIFCGRLVKVKNVQFSLKALGTSLGNIFPIFLPGNIPLAGSAALLDMVIKTRPLLPYILGQIPITGADLVQLMNQINGVLHRTGAGVGAVILPLILF